MLRNRNPLVFIVEDNPAYRTLLVRVLQKNGYMVMQFENGRKAADMLRYVKPEIIISDIEMPQMDGFEFNEFVKENFSKYDIPFLYLSSTNCETTKKKAEKLGAMNMLDKPISSDKLKKAIKQVLELDN